MSMSGRASGRREWTDGDRRGGGRGIPRGTLLGCAVALVAGAWIPVQAQEASEESALIAPPGSEARTVWPLSPRDRGMVGRGLPVSPVFEGWYENPDGTYTLSFGFFNRNTEEVVVIPSGEDNFIEPSEFDGGQPTIFPPRDSRGYSHGSSTGVFTVTVPGDFAESGGDVVWTVRANGFVHSVPGRIESEAYQLSLGPQAMGSNPPVLVLEEGGPELWGPFTAAGDPRDPTTERTGAGGSVSGSYGNPVSLAATVGTPLTLVAWAEDRFEHRAERERVTPGMTWFTHQGPGPVTFSESTMEVDASGRATTTATFPMAGRYLLRVRADNFNPVDSTPGDQCCWTNGYVEVTVGR